MHRLHIVLASALLLSGTAVAVQDEKAHAAYLQISNPAAPQMKDLPVFKNLSENFPDTSYGMYARAELMPHTPATADARIELLSSAIKLDESFSIAYLRRAEAWLQKEDYPKGLYDAEKALSLAPQLTDIYLVRADIFVRQKNLIEATSEYARFIKAVPHDIRGYKACESIFTLMNRPAEAKWCVFKQKEIELTIRKPETWYPYIKYRFIEQTQAPNLAAYIIDIPTQATQEALAKETADEAKREREEKAVQNPISVAGARITPAKSAERIEKVQASDIKSLGGFQKIYFALKKDLYSYYPETGKTYSTQEQRRRFETTPEYRTLLSKLQEAEKDIKNSYISVDLLSKLGHFDAKNKGFMVRTATNYGTREAAKHPTNIMGFCIPGLPLGIQENSGKTDFYLYLPVDTALSGAIKRDEKNVTLRLVVKPAAAITSPAYKFNGTSITDQCVSVSDAGLLLVNKDTDKVYAAFAFVE